MLTLPASGMNASAFRPPQLGEVRVGSPQPFALQGKPLVSLAEGAAAPDVRPACLAHQPPVDESISPPGPVAGVSAGETKPVDAGREDACALSRRRRFMGPTPSLQDLQKILQAGFRSQVGVMHACAGCVLE